MFSPRKGAFIAVHHELCGACHDASKDVIFK